MVVRRQKEYEGIGGLNQQFFCCCTYILELHILFKLICVLQSDVNRNPIPVSLYLISLSLIINYLWNLRLPKNSDQADL